MRKSVVGKVGRLVVTVLVLLAVAGAAWAADVDLSVSAYTWAPNPVVHNGTSTFAVTVTNNDAGTSAGSPVLTVLLPANVDFSAGTASSECVFDLVASPKQLVCTKPSSLAAQGAWNISFGGNGLTAGAQDTTATVTDASITDPNGGNNLLTKTVTVINGADLGITKTGPPTAAAGSVISFTLTAHNYGPDAATTFRITDNLPAAVDFTYQNATGSGWSCGVSGTTVTCDYSGTAVPSGSDAPAITLTGQLITSSGTITNGASIVSTDGTTGDPVSGNNGPSQVVVTVTAGTNLQAGKTMVSSVTGLTTFTAGESVTMTLSATNSGTQQASGVTITDTVPVYFAIGTLPAGCAAVGQVITCTIATLNSGATSSFTVPLTVIASPTLGAGSNSASISRTAPTGGTNTGATANYTISPPFAHLTLTKSKGPNPVAADGLITNTIVVTNSSSSTSAATGTIRVTDLLDSHETYQSFSGSGWSCSGVAVDATGTVTCDYAGANLARGASLPALVIITKAETGYLGTISNTACTGLSAASPHTPADNSSTGNCQSRSVTGTDRIVDLGITKVASIPSPTHVLTTDSSITYTLTVSNSGTDIAPTATVSDPLTSIWYSGSAGITSGSAVITGAVAGESCSFGSTVSCTLKNVANGAPRTITITLNRPFKDGTLVNTATVSTPDAIDANNTNNSASVTVIVDPLADVAVTGIAAGPDPVKVGVELSYTTSIKNNGPSSATGVVLRHLIDPTKVAYVAGSASLTVGGSCSYVSSFAGAPYAGQAGIQCDGFSLPDGQTRQLTFKVIPIYPYPGGVPNSYTSSAYITTTTVESDAPGYANNEKTNSVTITMQALDLTVTDNDPGFDPTAFGDSIVYEIKVQNNGPSQATGFKLAVTPMPPGVYTMPFDLAGSVLPGGATCSQPGGAGTDVICYLGVDQAHSVMAANTSQTFNLKFGTAGPTPAGSLTYGTTATVSSYETTAGYDSLPGNNSVTETTTVLPKTDLILVSKSVSTPVVDINEPFTYTVVVGNKGPSDVSGLKVTDILPAGLVMTGAVTVTPGSGVSLTTNSCTAPAVGSNGTVTCNLGPVPVDATGIDTTKQVAITIPVRAAYQASGTYFFAFNTNIPNTAVVAVLPGVSLDPDATNNTKTVNVQVRKNSITGTVYADNNLNDTIDSGEGINAVALTLSGTDSYGNTYGTGGGQTYAALTKNTNSSGVFLFDTLPPGTWMLVESQPAGYYDRFETSGTAGGAVPAATCDGTINCSSSAVANTIGAVSGANAITLPALTATAATGYVFQEYRRAQISGYVYHDANNDGDRASSGETGVASLSNHITLSGFAYNGVDVCTLVACTVSLNASGLYSYANLPPSDATGYSVRQNNQPVGYFDGKDQTGDGVGNVVAASTGRQPKGTTGNTDTESLTGVVLVANQSKTEHNFGELLPASISGSVFVDLNSDGIRDVGETGGVPSVTVTLNGTDDLGPVSAQVTTTDGSGNYSFTNLRPGTYSVTEAPPSGLTHTGAQAGTAGGTGGVGLSVVSVTGITLSSGTTATGYNFGESGQGLSGYVYVDLNSNGVKDAGEPGIPGVAVTLSGQTVANVNVCTAIAPNPCSVTTGSDGGYNFVGLPASNATGYTITEQSQAAVPLSNYTDGAESLGTLGGTIGADQFTGIVQNVGQFGTGYNFGEHGASLAGRVYLDVNDDGILNGGDTGIAGGTITLSGTTASGANVCTVMAVAYPTCSVTPAADGTYAFTGLPAGTYALTQAQPVDYANRTTATGTPAGTATTGTTISGIPLTAGQAGSGYLFGEKTGSITGFVYHDANNDGVKDAGEPGIAGVELALSGNTASNVDVCTTTSCTATTAADGSYSFTAVRNAGAGGYTIIETQATGYLDGKETAGTQAGTVDNSSFDATAAKNRISAIPFSAAVAATGYNFGEVQSGGLAGRVYHDANNNNSYDTGEELSNVTVTLTGLDDQGSAVNIAVTTAADGSYSFTNLRPSNGAGYIITEIQPNGIGDFPAASGTQVGTIAGTSTGVPALNQITGVVLASGQSGINYNFRESASSLTGSVYLDANDNGGKDGGETGIAGVTITLSGTDANSVAVNRTTITAADGSYSFIGLTSGSYTLTETQPVIYQDGREAAGSPAGTVDNSSFTSAAAQNSISTITLPVATAGTGYLFGERTGLTGSFSGKVWYNSVTRDQSQQSGEPGLTGWRVEVVQGGVVLGTATSAADGTWTVSGLPAGPGYEIRYRHPVNSALYGNPVSQDPGYVDSILDYTAHTIANLTLRSGGNVVEQNLPIDPSGVVYNSITRATVSGATVSITGPSGFNAATHLVGGAVNQTQTTDASGFYQFLLLPAAPAGTYTLTVNGPAGYVPGASSIIPAVTTALTPPAGPGNYEVQTQAAAPTGAQSTTYYLTINLNAASANVVNNHLPIDPILGGAIFVTKTTPKVNVPRGDLVPYTIQARNTLSASIPNIDLIDELPPGFKYRSGSARLNGVALEPQATGRIMRWPNLTFAPNEIKTLTLVLVVGSGVGDGEYVNRAWALNNLVNSAVSNVATATVKVVPDPTFDCTDIIGKVFDDQNANGYQDSGEPGIPNIRIATAKGWLVTTDAEGRFHVPCAIVPQMDRGSNFIMKLDERTLPSGFRVTTENPRVVRATRGKMVKLNFGATIHRVVRVEVNSEAFEKDSVELKEEWKKRFAALPEQLRSRPSVVRLVFRQSVKDESKAKERLKELTSMLRRKWEALDEEYPLSIEDELLEVAK